MPFAPDWITRNSPTKREATSKGKTVDKVRIGSSSTSFGVLGNLLVVFHFVVRGVSQVNRPKECRKLVYEPILIFKVYFFSMLCMQNFQMTGWFLWLQ